MVTKMAPLYLFSFILIGITLGFGADLFAQEWIIAPENKFKFEINGGYAQPYSDVKRPEQHAVLGISGAYIPYRFMELAFTTQKGTLQEGYRNTRNNGMRYKNSFFSATFSVRFLPLQLLKQENDKSQKYLNLSAGIGIGGILSKVNSFPVENINAGTIPFYQGLNLLVPLELGYTFPLYTYYNIPVYTEVHRKRIMFQVRYCYNLTSTDKLDGYLPNSAFNKNKDGFMQLTCGIAYLF